jgi:hypothetical protein
LSRLIGTVAVFIGAGIIVVSPHAWAPVIFTLPSDRDIHVYDLVGMIVIASGVLLFWR